MVGLPYAKPGFKYGGSAMGVSADGSVVVGHDGALVPGGYVAVIWENDNSMRNLNDVLADDFGLDLTGWTLTHALSISDDGMVIVGYGENPSGETEAWIAVIPEPATLSLLALGGLAVMRCRRK